MARKAFEHQVPYLIYEVERLMSREYDRRMRTLGLTRAQWWVLARLYFNDGVTQSELAEDLGFSKAALGGLLDRLESNGWLERRAHPHDRRAKCVFRTSKVEALLGRMEGIALDMSADLLSGLLRGQREELRRLLVLLKANLEARERSSAA